jgi:hypothetical protein
LAIFSSVSDLALNDSKMLVLAFIDNASHFNGLTILVIDELNVMAAKEFAPQEICILRDQIMEFPHWRCQICPSREFPGCEARDPIG